MKNDTTVSNRAHSAKNSKKIPLNIFGTAFGTSGLASTWLAMAEFGHAPKAIGTALLCLAAAVWLVALVAYVRYAITRRTFVRDLLDPVAAPFASLALIVGMILAAEGLYPHAPSLGRGLFDVFLVLTVLLAGWFTGQWIYKPVDIDKFHPGYFLPTVAGGLVGAYGSALVGQHALGEAMFGLGIICWLILGSVIMGRLLFRPTVPELLLPTYAIEVAPPAVATFAYLALNGGHFDNVAAFLAGYGLLMVVAQLRLLPAYVRLPFAPSTWAFTFSWAAVAIAAAEWLEHLKPAGYQTYEYIIVAAITALIGGIGVKTLIALAQGTFLPAEGTTPKK